MKRLTSAPWAALALGLVFASFHLACLAGRTVGFILGHAGEGEGEEEEEREGGRREEEGGRRERAGGGFFG